jgi:hypothetical protein
MTPKEKAEELYLEYYQTIGRIDGRYKFEEIVKQCALIAVETHLEQTCYEWQDESYWQEVKQEIEKL